jgi:hypothetical protein
MAFNWNKNLENNYKVDKFYSTPKLKQNSCTSYNSAFSPTCTNRGKYRKEVRLCWDTIQNLKYSNGRFMIDGESYILLVCSSCEDYYIEKKLEGKEENLEQIFKCYECFQKENR